MKTVITPSRLFAVYPQRDGLYVVARQDGTGHCWHNVHANKESAAQCALYLNQLEEGA